MCGVLEVSENGYFNWRKRGICQRKQDDRQLTERIEDAFHDNRGVYGSPRIHAELKEQGIRCRRKRIVRLMQDLHIMARRKRQTARKTDSTHPFPLAPNILKRDFTADAPNQKWMTDMTFIATSEGWLYLAGVIDAYSRKLIGWAMGKEHDALLVKQALQMALVQREPGADLIHHSDRGSEYASQSYQEMLRQRGIQVSMSRKGDCYDNALIESFWGTLKEEGIGQTIYQTREEAKTAVFDYIEVFYNRKRKHSSLGYLSPVDYEKLEKEKNT
jgi:transposase InsO family protein